MDISCAVQHYYLQLGEINSFVGLLKKFLRSRPYLKHKPSPGNIFDVSTQFNIKEFQQYKRLPVVSGYFNAETYAALGKEMTPQQISIVSTNHPVLKWLLLGSPKGAIPFDISKGTRIETQNGNADDIKADQQLEQLLTKGGIVRAASVGNRGNYFLNDTHFTLRDGKVFTIHIYGDPEGITTTGVYLPSFFNAPVYDGGDTVFAITQTKEVLGIAHLRVSSQSEVDRNYKSGKENEAGSKYVGEIGGIGGDSVCYRHAHLHFFPNAAARTRIKTLKSNGYDDVELKHSKDVLDVRDLL